jgi:hypothetical protein
MTDGQKKLRAWLRKKAPSHQQMHKSLFCLACLSRDAGYDIPRTRELVMAYASGGSGRQVPLREVDSAVQMAFSQSPSKRSIQFPEACPRLIAEVSQFKAPVPYPVHPEEPPEFFLRQMFSPTDLLCIGATAFAMDTRPLQDWEGMLRPMQFLVPSPMISETGPRKQDGQPSFHAESNTGTRKFLITEFDGPDRPTQMALLRSLAARGPLLLAALVDSAGKSLHAFWRAHSDEHTNFEFFSHACRLGADPRLWLRSQFARLPGGTRSGKRQEVLFFQPTQ